ncbi:E1-E2 ATPase family protein (macronuclear) [Tetrahymena thermophila SB210]|uniref:E1-E2 ATPase family protein n=1 Tax=Tetrahymena thermophila (strain SB210) TaxID=312017 RepID=Q22V49_TETTS|nr:E1-E2 ATPase family protein [Tetrahymena thermophila SB210]EAR89099.1 E1-E2 ATPase family protein [Tetrahymena thermophila SB210]|eukprot:XP_001009344.1 E1-E2 ATPase family protein [Tetrahymena thermophila SB210]
MLSVENIHGKINQQYQQQKGEVLSQLNFTSRNNSPMLPKSSKQESDRASETNSSNNTNQPNFNQVTIVNCDVEGDQKVIKIEALQMSSSKVLLCVLSSIMTCLVFALFLRNSLRIRLKCLYNKCLVYDATHFLITNFDNSQEVVKRIQHQDKTKILFINRHMKYQYFEDDSKKAFYPVYYHQIEKQTLRDIKGIHSQGLTTQKVEAHLQKYGNCEIHIPIPTIFEYLAETLTNIFFIFQYLTVLLWVLEGYLLFAVVMIVSSVIITLINYFLLRLSLDKLKKFAKIDLRVRVIRNGVDQEIKCNDLLPGDIFFYKNDMSLPCDSMLLSGDVLVNESSLTGESLPIPKISIDQNDQQDDFFHIENMKNHILYEGTKVIQIKGQEVKGMVLRTGYASFRGSIFRAMLYPKQISFNFYRNGIYFMLILIAIGIIIYFIELKFIIDTGIATTLIIYRFFDTATWMIPPALPIFFSVCQTVSLLRMGTKKILATDPAKVVVAGDVSIMCFDKTGTLTKDSMETYGYSDHNCNKIKQSLEYESEKEKLLHKFFGSCHGVYLVNGKNLGDELDVRMLEFSQYHILPGESKDFKFQVQRNSDNSLLTIFKVWEFESSLQRMTVVIKDEQAQKLYGIVKGSPEKIYDLCDKSSINEENFKKLLNEMTNKGLRVIAFGYKEIQDKESHRDAIEQNIQFLGIFVLENKLKVDTADVIKRLQNGNILCKVISGDNLLTTIQCAKEANILPSDASRVLVCNSINDCYVQSTLEKKDPLQLLESNEEVKRFKIGITGKFLEELQNIFCKKFGDQEQKILQNLLIQSVVFSRCKPKQKAELVYLFQTVLNEKVGMIGDGANDCSAIKQADIGISFATTDASYSSPFSYSETSLDCVIKILAEGRCTLSSMIECYRYYLTVSFHKFTLACILILELSYMSSIQVIFINYFVSIPYLIMLSLSKPLEDLTPYKSISNMLDIENFFSVFGQIVLSVGQFLAHYFHLRSQSWYVQITHVADTSKFFTEGQAVTVLFLSVTFAFVVSIVAYYISYPTKQRIYQNKILFVTTLAVYIYMFFLYLLPSKSGEKFFGLDHQTVSNTHFMGMQLIIALCFGFGTILYEECIVKRYLGPHRKSLNALRKTNSLTYQNEKN